VDTSPVDATPYVPQGHGRETTFQENLTDWAAIEEETRRLTARVLDDIRREGRPAVRVGLKIRLAPFETRSRSLTLPGPTYDETELAEAAIELLGRLDAADRDRALSRGVRLLGIRLEMQPVALV